MEIFNLSNAYLITVFFILGMFFGSFYNVVGLRVPNNKSIINPGSHCPKCNHKLKWYELIPVFSYILLLGKCSSCKSKIAIIYPIIEIVTGVLFALSFLVFGLSFELLYSVIFVSTLVIIIVSDIHYMVIPDSVLLVGGMLLLISSLLFKTNAEILYSVLNAGLAFGTMYLIKMLGDRLFKKESMGDGDIKLMAIIGFVLGSSMSVITIFLASLLALPVALILLKIKKTKILPFGPFLSLASLILFLLRLDIVTVMNYIT